MTVYESVYLSGYYSIGTPIHKYCTKFDMNYINTTVIGLSDSVYKYVLFATRSPTYSPVRPVVFYYVKDLAHHSVHHQSIVRSLTR